MINDYKFRSLEHLEEVREVLKSWATLSENEAFKIGPATKVYEMLVVEQMTEKRLQVMRRLLGRYLSLLRKDLEKELNL